MATKSENAEIAVLQDQMSTVKETLVDIKADTKSIVTSMNALPSQYVAQPVFQQHVERTEAAHREIYDQIASLGRSNYGNKILWFVIGTTISALVYYFITNTVGHH